MVSQPLDRSCSIENKQKKDELNTLLDCGLSFEELVQVLGSDMIPCSDFCSIAGRRNHWKSEGTHCLWLRKELGVFL